MCVVISVCDYSQSIEKSRSLQILLIVNNIQVIYCIIYNTIWNRFFVQQCEVYTRTANESSKSLKSFSNVLYTILFLRLQRIRNNMRFLRSSIMVTKRKSNCLYHSSFFSLVQSFFRYVLYNLQKNIISNKFVIPEPQKHLQGLLCFKVSKNN